MTTIAINHETYGDQSEIECPWCGETMWISDDGDWASSGVDCEHCKRTVTLTHDISVSVTARRDHGVKP